VRRERLFLLITVLLPLLLLAGAEVVLRATGAGGLEPLFIPVRDAPGYLQPNPAAVQRFFPDPRRAPDVAIDTAWFAARKEPGKLRIFVQGESSAAGFPYGRWASPAALLQERLQRAYPDRNVEVINTAMAAVTSYVLLDFADEIIAQHADAVVIYTGHNEYLGIGGVGSSYASAKSPALARMVAGLRHLHVYRALEKFIASFGGSPDPLDKHDGTLMSHVARERSIPLGSPLYEQGLAQFRGNLDRLLQKYRAAGIPVFIGTLASNERDQAPFVSAPASAGGDSAAAHFAAARDLDRAGRYDEARAQYVEAKDRDELRFRAPESFNALIRELAAADGATLVDVHSALAAAARDGIIGNDMMLEHVHPNVEGYFQLASAYYPAITAWAGQPAVVVDDAAARREIPVTEVDRLAGEYRVAVLKNDWPFVPQRQPTRFPLPANPIEDTAQAWFAKRISWADAMQRALAYYQQAGNTDEAARVAVNLADAFVAADNVQYIAGKLLLRANQPERGGLYVQRALRLNPASIEYRLSLAESQAKSGHPEASIATLEAVVKAHPGDERAKYWLGEMRARAAAAPVAPAQ
jgi:tetratricopeptide (TPR) repeat protein